MRRLATALSCLAILAVSATPATGQIRFGAHASYDGDFDFGIGGRLHSSLRSFFPRTPLEFQGTFEYYFPDDGGGVDITHWQINTNINYQIPVQRGTSLAPYVGAGLNIGHVKVDVTGFGSADDTELGFNILGGLQFKTSSRLAPFVEVRLRTAIDESVVLSGGVLF